MHLLLIAMFIRAPVRLLSARALRQAVLRASSRLAPCLTLRQQALRPAGGQDARCVQPTSATCLNDVTRTSCVPGSLSRLSPRGRPAETKAPRDMTGGPGVSRHPRPLRRIVTGHALPRFLLFWSRGVERGRFLPTAPDATEPLTPLSPLPLSRNVGVAFALRTPFELSDVR
jgi:hypothetical protein